MEVAESRINNIKETIKMIQLFMNLPEIKILQITDYDAYYKHLAGIFPSFVENYECLFELIIKGSDLGILDIMFNTMLNISSGTVNQEEEEKRLGDILADKYVKSKLDITKLKKC